eukprot:1867127-Pleurochrysis_carterae.AAC.2
MKSDKSPSIHPCLSSTRLMRFLLTAAAALFSSFTLEELSSYPLLSASSSPPPTILLLWVRNLLSPATVVRGIVICV